jgi:hypothetical protein
MTIYPDADPRNADWPKWNEEYRARNDMEALLEGAAEGADDELRDLIKRLRAAIRHGRAALAASLAIELWEREVVSRVAVIDGKVESSKAITPHVRKSRKQIADAAEGGRQRAADYRAQRAAQDDELRSALQQLRKQDPRISWTAAAERIGRNRDPRMTGRAVRRRVPDMSW